MFFLYEKIMQLYIVMVVVFVKRSLFMIINFVYKGNVVKFVIVFQKFIFKSFFKINLKDMKGLLILIQKLLFYFKNIYKNKI